MTPAAPHAPASFGGKKVDLKDLQYFIAVYEAGGFSHASKCLDTVQSNISARIRSLEASIGAALFERNRRGVVPTTRGHKLYRHAKQVMAALHLAERAMKATRAT
jgi:DNA-binding transcriptional LysR family regulator